MKFVRTLISALTLSAAAGAVQASVVSFADTTGNNWVASTFADGTFTHNLNSNVEDGFYRLYGNSDTLVTNFYGYNNEAILFNQNVTLNSLQLGDYNNYNGATLTASLYYGADNLLAYSTIDNPSELLETLTFGTANTRKVVFSFTGGSEVYGLGFNSLWYALDNVDYTVGGQSTTPSDVPEPASLALFGLGAAGLAFARRRKSA